jgi:acyl-CoA dehydrogenase
MSRLMVLRIAHKMEHGLDISQENLIAKNFIADMLSSVVDTALQIHGALGYTPDTPLAAWYAEVRMQHLVDRPDEVHRWRIGRSVLAAQRKSGTTVAAAGGDLF